MTYIAAYLTIRALDIISTVVAYDTGGLETNPLSNALLGYGLVWFSLLNGLISLVLLGLVFHFRRVRGVWLGFKLFIVLNVVVVILNIFGIVVGV